MEHNTPSYLRPTHASKQRSFNNFMPANQLRNDPLLSPRYRGMMRGRGMPSHRGRPPLHTTSSTSMRLRTDLIPRSPVTEMESPFASLRHFDESSDLSSNIFRFLFSVSAWVFVEHVSPMNTPPIAPPSPAPSPPSSPSSHSLTRKTSPKKLLSFLSHPNRPSNKSRRRSVEEVTAPEASPSTTNVSKADPPSTIGTPFTSIWDFYDKPLGHEVSVIVDDQDETFYFVPHLSAVQLFAPITDSSESTQLDSPQESDHLMRHDNSSRSQSEAAPSPASQVKQEPLPLLPNTGHSEAQSEVGRVLFEFYESEKPGCRLPVMDKITQLSERFPMLLHGSTADIDTQRSWFAIVWYPILSFRKTTPLLSGSFLTVHSFVLDTHPYAHLLRAPFVPLPAPPPCFRRLSVGSNASTCTTDSMCSLITCYHNSHHHNNPQKQNPKQTLQHQLSSSPSVTTCDSPLIPQIKPNTGIESANSSLASPLNTPSPRPVLSPLSLPLSPTSSVPAPLIDPNGANRTIVLDAHAQTVVRRCVGMASEALQCVEPGQALCTRLIGFVPIQVLPDTWYSPNLTNPFLSTIGDRRATQAIPVNLVQSAIDFITHVTQSPLPDLDHVRRYFHPSDPLYPLLSLR